MEGREEQSREHGAALGQGTHPFSRDVHNDIFDLFCKTKTSTKWKMLTAWWSILVSRERVPVQWRTTGGHHTPDDLWIGTRQALQATWTLPTALAIKLLIHPPAWDSFEGHQPAGPPLLGIVIKLFFSASPQILSLRFSLVPVYKGKFLSYSVNSG